LNVVKIVKEFLCALQDVAREANEFLSSFGGLNESRLAAIDKLTAIQPLAQLALSSQDTLTDSCRCLKQLLADGFSAVRGSNQLESRQLRKNSPAKLIPLFRTERRERTHIGQKRSGDGGASCQAGSLTPCRVAIGLKISLVLK
jgi:hypothetical protein